jgi:outer membrane protein OmpA-like peptidoglycan-associated protein
VFVDGSTVYVGTYGGTDGGLRISTDGGATFTTKTTVDGLGNNGVGDVYAVGSTIYAATNEGFSISTNGGTLFTNTRLSGLGDWIVYDVYAVGSTIYAATASGLSISTNGGASFTNKTVANSGLGDDTVRGVFAVVAPALQVTNKEIAGNTATLTTSTAHGLAVGSVVDVSGVDATFNGTYTVTAVTTSAPYQFSYAKTAADVSSTAVSPPGVATFNTVYAATGDGVSISTNGGATFTNKLEAAGTDENSVNGVYADGSTVYAATEAGLSISTDGGATFTTKTTANGLGSDNVYDVFAVGTTVYAGTEEGLSISTNGGTSFTNDTTENCLGSNYVYGVYAVGSTIYAATYGGGLSISNGLGAGCRTSGGGGGSSSSETPEPTPTPTPVVVIPVVEAIPPGTNPNIPASGLTPGSSVFLVNGVASTLTIKPNQPVDPKSLVATGDGFTMEIEGRRSTGQPLGLTSDAALRLERGSTASVKGTGFAPNSDVQVHLFSTARFLGTIRTNASGAFDGSVPVPADVELGRHTLQAAALGADNNVRTLSLGVVLEAPVKPVRTAKATVSFDPLSAALTPKAKKALRALAQMTKGTATTGLAIGYVQKDGNPANDTSLSKQRARVIAAFLKANGMTAPLSTRGDGVLSKKKTGRAGTISVIYTD